MRYGHDRTLVLGGAWTLFLFCSILPIVWMLVQSGGALRAAATALMAERQHSLMTQTLSLGLGSAAGALLVGFPLGIALARCDPQRVRLTRFALLVPLVLPPYVLALAWIVIAEANWMTWTYGPAAAMATLAFSLYPIVMLSTEAGLRSVSAHVEEAARLVASPSRVWLNVLGPLMMPSLAASILIVFVLAISDFAIASILRVRVYTTEVFTAFSALYDFRLATVMALPLAAAGGVASVAALTMSRRALTGRTDRGPLALRWPQSIQGVAAATLLAVALGGVALPVGAIANEARAGRAVLADAASLEAALNSVVWSFAAASLVLIVAVLLGYWRTRSGALVGHVAEAMWVALFALPATVAGVGIIGLWNRPGMAGDIYRSDAIVVVAYASRFLPIAALLCAAFLRRVAPAAEEAAIISGASWTRALIRVVVPLSSRGLAAVWLVMFILMFGDVSLAILVAPPGESNLPVRAYTLMANSPVGDVARIALVQIGLSVLPLSAIALLLRPDTVG